MSLKEFPNNELFTPTDTKLEVARSFIESNLEPISVRKTELTEREKEIITEILAGKSLNEISANKNIKLNTVYQSLKKIKNKLYGGALLKNLDFEDFRQILIYTNSLTNLT